MRRKDFLIAAVFIGALFSGPLVKAESLRQKVVAGFVFNFIKFAEWPDLPREAPLNLCVAADAELFSILNEFAGKKVIGHQLHVSALETSQLQQCQVLFIDRTKASQQDCASVIAVPQLLTISDIPYFAGHCGMIGLYEENDQLHFEVNIANVERSGIRLGSQLLRLARILRENIQ